MRANEAANESELVFQQPPRLQQPRKGITGLDQNIVVRKHRMNIRCFTLLIIYCNIKNKPAAIAAPKIGPTTGIHA